MNTNKSDSAQVSGEAPTVSDDGGPAFPASPTIGPSGDLYRPVDIGCSGMTLRDYFAAKAMPAVLQLVYQGHNVKTRDNSAITEGTIAAQAYAIADAMLKARSA